MSVADTTHECPAPGCEMRVPFHLFACQTHWYSLPQRLRKSLWREWRNHPGEASYFKVRANCLRALGVPEDQVAELNGGAV